MTAYCVLNTLFRYHDKNLTSWAGEVHGRNAFKTYIYSEYKHRDLRARNRIVEGTRYPVPVARFCLGCQAAGRKSVTALSRKANMKIFELLQFSATATASVLVWVLVSVAYWATGCWLCLGVCYCYCFSGHIFA